MTATLQACTRCKHEIEPGDRFCQECGLVMQESPPAAAQPPETMPAVTVSQVAPEDRAGRAPQAVAAPRVLNSPILKQSKPEKSNPSQSIAASNFALLDLLCLAVVLSFAGTLAFWMFTTQAKLEKAQIKTKLAKATQYFKKEDYRTAAASLESVQLFVKLPQAEHAMLDTALIHIARQAAAQGKLDEALTALKKVSHTSPQYSQARVLEMALSNPPAPVVEDPAPRPPRRRYLPPVISEQKVLSLPELEELVGAAPGQTTIESPEQELPDSEKPSPTPKAPRFSESEVSTYNRMLASFYARSGERDNSAAPTFSEWLRSGKQTF